MCEPKRDLLRQKLDHIKKDYDAALSGCLHNGDRVSRIRTWSVTVFAAYLGYMLKSDTPSTVPLWPLVGAIGLFWIMEGFTVATSLLTRCTVLGEVDKLFTITDENQFWNKVEEYRFCRLQDKPFVSERPKEKKWSWEYEHSRTRRFWKGFRNEQALVFYGIPLVLLVGLAMGRLFLPVSTNQRIPTGSVNLDLSGISLSAPTARESLTLKPAPPTKRPPTEHKSTRQYE